MSLNSTPSADRIHIGIFGRRNAGKSSIINAITGQDLAIVSDVKGTTTDPVLKAMELLPLGPVVFIDTPGLDDEGTLGEMRIKKAYQMLNKSDIALLVIDSTVGMTDIDQEILSAIQTKKIPYLIVYNKCDLESVPQNAVHEETEITVDRQLFVSAESGLHIQELKEQIAALVPNKKQTNRIIGDLLTPGSFVLLVVPIDSAAPKGRLILPQQQTIRDILDTGATAIVVRDSELSDTLTQLGTLVSLVVTDSQVFQKVAAIVPPEIPLTSFSILFARYKGNLETVVHGAQALDHLQDGDQILISEGCTHHRQCEDIGTVKLPRWIRNHTQKKLRFSFTSGAEFPTDLSSYRLIIHCGGCMLTEREMKYRLRCAKDAGIPITNYGTAIAHMQGILERSIQLFRSKQPTGLFHRIHDN